MRQSCARIGPRLTIAALAALLTGCGQVSSSGGCEAFPRPVPYSRDAQTQAALDLAALPQASPLRPMIEELGAYRARWRAVCG